MMERRRRGASSGLALMLLASLAACAGAATTTRAQQGWTPETVPNPTLPGQAAQCGRHMEGTAPGATSFLCDPDKVLSRDGALLVNKELERLQREVKLDCAGRQEGVQMATVLVKKMRPTHLGWENTQEAAAFARKLHDAWGVGHATCQDGVLMLVSVQDRAMYISKGRGLEELLTDNRLDQVVERMKHLLRERRFDDALLLGVVDVEGWVKKGPPGFWEKHLGLIVFAAFALAVGFIIVSSVIRDVRRNTARRRAFDEAKRKLERIDRDKERLERLARAGQFGALTSCPVCLEDFTEVASDGEDATRRPLMAPEGGQTPAASASDFKGADGQPVAVLECGHAFCIKCLMQSIEAAAKCPICRQDIAGMGGGAGGGGGGGDLPPSDRRPGPETRFDDDQGGAGGAARVRMRPPTQPNVGPPGFRSNRWDRPPACQPAGDPLAARLWAEAEVLYRLRSLQRMYPEVVTGDHIDRWTRGGYRNTYARDPTFLNQDPRVSQPSAPPRPFRPDSPRRSFGGGSSAGGRGGSW